MTATVEFQQNLFDEPFSQAEMMGANRIASYLPDSTTLAVERGPAGITFKATARITAALQLSEFPDLGDEHDYGLHLAERLGSVVRELGEALP